MLGEYVASDAWVETRMSASPAMSIFSCYSEWDISRSSTFQRLARTSGPVAMHGEVNANGLPAVAVFLSNHAFDTHREENGRRIRRQELHTVLLERIDAQPELRCV